MTETLDQKKARLLTAMASRLGGARDLASLRRDIDSLPESEADRLLKHYAGGSQHVM